MRLALLTLLALFSCSPESARLLSVARADKMIVVSLQPSKERVMLDGSTARIIIFGKPGEWKDLSSYSLIHIKWERKPINKLDQVLDGIVHEICIEP